MNDFATMAASLRGSEPRVLSGDATLSASALSAFEKSLADALDAHGLRRIASRLDNGPAWLALDLAIRRLGGVHIPLPTFFSAGQVTHALRSSGAEAVVTAAGESTPIGAAASDRVRLADGLVAWRLHSDRPALPDGTACITYTSGTTGQAKGVCLDAASGAGALRTSHQVPSASRPISSTGRYSDRRSQPC